MPHPQRTSAAITAASTFFRVFEIICGGIIVGILAYYQHRVDKAPDGRQSARILYSLIIGCVGLIWSLLAISLFKLASFHLLLDFILFAGWIVAFALLVNLTANDDICSSSWFAHYWAYYWGGWWSYFLDDLAISIPIGYAPGCASWQTVLAFLFIGAVVFLCSAVVGCATLLTRLSERRSRRDTRKPEQDGPV
ncbi:uncharacterized protein BO80DRAFT_444529 [Aspergillus ibericus CBS 121593]|uniref:MARVEL domain-containing protein n=1 Tax=Aspergillus ibericus CBS 121593 TaxID=1448316 RepID=A0A395H1C1_9EURO|nr:hypothetical protein BO80DRAFT_444529 [Aspergillus ibericus CBS 121593]RAL01453.1 hypothetical protein BO80DRAFT_444529 [Aspergillus ibericus CBS 121593]